MSSHSARASAFLILGGETHSWTMFILWDYCNGTPLLKNGGHLSLFRISAVLVGQLSLDTSFLVGLMLMAPGRTHDK